MLLNLFRLVVLVSILPATLVGADKGNILIISPPTLKKAWKDYALLRSAPGRSVSIIDTGSIDIGYQGADLQEKIRQCIRKQVETQQAKWVILGGDSSPGGGLIPDRDTYHDNHWGKEKDIPSDLYYISPTNWDHDQDGIYGEWEDDKQAITYPDGSVAIGRIPVRTVEDVKAYTDKVRHYLESAEKQSAQGELTLTCASRGAYPKVYRSGRELIPAKWSEGTINFLFNDKSSWDREEPGDYDLSARHLVEKMNEGKTNKWHLHGHGLIDQWILEDKNLFTIEQISELTNLDRLPVITTVSCFTGQFDAKQDPCVTEAMLRHPTGGAIAIVAPSRTGKPHFHDPKNDFPLMVKEGKLDGTTQTMTSFWIAALGEDKTTGEALALAKAGLADDARKSANYHQCLCEINLLGDPSLPVN
ncbi:C25 family cysteine peptidase [Haloferula sp.]|uniref:C25 family cysteine peptidase n=1 Tax=Haloferula sp. TaxID=2497595 RepID=UPI00329E5D63